MIAGQIILEDQTIVFHRDGDLVEYTITEITNTGLVGETFTVEANKFFKALAIAVHNDGMPDYIADYLDAESIQGRIRWIP